MQTLLAQAQAALDDVQTRLAPWKNKVARRENIYEGIRPARDAQFRSLMMIELGTDAAKLVSVLNYDGMPITADNIFRQITLMYPI